MIKIILKIYSRIKAQFFPTVQPSANHREEGCKVGGATTRGVTENQSWEFQNKSCEIKLLILFCRPGLKKEEKLSLFRFRFITFSFVKS